MGFFVFCFVLFLFFTEAKKLYPFVLLSYWWTQNAHFFFQIQFAIIVGKKCLEEGGMGSPTGELYKVKPAMNHLQYLSPYQLSCPACVLPQRVTTAADTIQRHKPVVSHIQSCCLLTISSNRALDPWSGARQRK